MGDVPPQHWTQDEAQLERLVSSSALGRREKWRRRSDYRERTIRKVLANLGETYDWPQEVGGSRPRSFSSSPHSPLGVHGDDENNEEAKIVRFAELGEPKEREYLTEKIGVKGYPIVAFGAGGVAKSFAMLAGGVAIASASGVEEWLGLRVLDHGHVLYLDFEGGEQARRRAHPRSPGDGGRHRSGPRTAHRRRAGDGLQQPLSRSMKTDPPQVEEAGYKGRSKLYRLFSSSSTTLGESEVMKTSPPTTVAELFASPPSWLSKQLDVYRRDPVRQIKPLCSSVAAVVLGDGARGDAVREEVEKELERQGR